MVLTYSLRLSSKNTDLPRVIIRQIDITKICKIFHRVNQDIDIKETNAQWKKQELFHAGYQWVV